MSAFDSARRAEYRTLLSAYLAGGGEEMLLEAYAFGRQALNDGIGVLDLTMLHHEVLAELDGGEVPAERTGMAAEFLAECLSSFEMTLRSYQQTNADLIALNSRLEQANAENLATNEQLKAEIGERERAEDALRQAQKLQVVGQLAGGIAHNFNNLLTVVLGNLELAQGAVDKPERLKTLLRNIQIASDRAAKITKQLLAFSRRQMLNPKTIAPSQALREMVSLLANALNSDIRIETVIPNDLWTIEIDPMQLELTLLNLGVNARDAMPKGGTLRISASNQTVRNARLGLAGTYLAVEIADTGTGIAPDILPMVFEPFFTTKDVGAGTGLGLSQVYGFAHQSGGAVDIESELGKGTRITLYLRAFDRSAAEEAPKPRLVERYPMTVLIVEDELQLAELAADLLRQFGFDIKLTYRANAALDLLKQGEKVDLIFSDIKMPEGMSGIALADEVKSRYPDIPILLATGYSDAATDALAHGHEIIAKPYRSAELMESIGRLLGSE